MAPSTSVDTPTHSAHGPGEQVTDRVRLLRRLGAGGMGTVWAAHHDTLGIDVAVKFVHTDSDPQQVDRLAREARMAAMVDHPNAVRVLDHGVSRRGAPFLVMELLEGESLGARLARLGRLSPDAAADVVDGVAAALQAAHDQGVVHRDVKPDNVVLVGDDPAAVKLVDFGVARPVDLGLTTLTGVGQILGTPVYMSPEQLVEVLPADRGADLWGLSVSAYEMVTGRRPFDGRTLAAVVVALMSRRFEPPTAVSGALPSSLDAFFDRAFAQEPSARFSSATELAEAFRRAVRGDARPSSGRATRALRIPDRVYGRDAELSVLSDALQAVPQGSRAVLISGYSGIGKTSLVVELRRRLRAGTASVAVGKFDQYDRGRPYHSLIQAFRTLVRTAVEQRDPTVATWRDRLLETVSEGGASVLTDVIGELEEVIGPQPTLEEVPPEERRARFQVAVGRLVAALATAERPLVVFCDDLQWADLASLDLLTALATAPDSRNVLLVCAYRDNEVTGTHPLLATLDRMRAGGRVDELSVGPLDVDAVLDLVGDTFASLPGRMRLAAAAHAKTRGNPFFLRRFLEDLVERELVRHVDGRWTWDEAAVVGLDLPEDVVAYVGAEIARMPADAQAILGAAACVGDTFELDVVAHALALDPFRALEALRPVVASELVVAADRAGPMSFRFAHDRVRQAARASLADDAATRVHRRVGRFLLEHLRGSELDARLFEVVEHLDRGGDEDLSTTDRGRLLGLNLEAGRRAIRSAAFDVGERYLRTARGLLEPDSWAADHPRAVALHIEGARAAYLVGDHGTMDGLVEEALTHAQRPLDRVAALEVRMQARLSQQRFPEALQLALRALRELGVALPEEVGPDDVQAALTGALAAVAAHTEAELGRMPLSEDPFVQAAMRIRSGAMSSAYMASPPLLPVLAAGIVRTTLERGVCKESPYGFAALGLVCNAVNLLEEGHRLGRMASQMLDRVGERSTRPRTLHVLAAHVMLFAEPLRDCVELERQVARLGFDTGDLEYAAWGLHGEVCNGFYAGVPLPELAATTARNLEALEHHQQLAALGCTVQYDRAMAVLRDGGPPTLDGDGYDERERMASFRRTNYRGAAFVQAVTSAFVRVVFGDLEGALTVLDEGAEFSDGAVATYHQVWWHQLRVLAVLGAAADPSALADVAPQLEQLRAWRRVSAANHGHRMDLVDGEIARVEGRHADALRLLRSAADQAGAQGFVHEQALAQELRARLHRTTGDLSAARAVARDAAATWERWGALAKAQALRDDLATW
ncbi:MAG: serine/threonine-protein kinase PknK [Alphaproteobacteria bacterium]|nr:serine/threonine-protein kinase PknK [Alphaproteobacteria bacterium]